MSPSERLQRWKPWGLAALCGVLGPLGYVGFDQFYLQWIFLVPLLWAFREATPKRAFFIAWAGGTLAHAGGFYWIAGMLVDFARVPWAIGVVGLFGIAAVNALSFGLWGWAVRRLQVDLGWHPWWTAPLVWVAVEHAYPFLFPNYLGASQYLVPALTQIADLTGILGVTFWLVWCNSTLFSLLEWKFADRPLPRRPLLGFAVATLLVVGYGLVRIHGIEAQMAAAPKIKVGLVQTNIGAAAKHHDRKASMRMHREMSTELEQREDLDLIVWPEGAYNIYLRRETRQLSERVLGIRETPLLLGALTREIDGRERRRYNSALILDAEHRIQGRYDKRVLVPFGEYIPLGDTFPIIYKWSPYSGRYHFGQSMAPLPLGEFTLSTNICYEDLFPGLIRDLMNSTLPEGPLPHALVNITNDSWYGDSTEPMEHLVLASFRAIEHRRPLIRSTNTGISALVDPIGRFTAKSGQWTREVVIGDVPMMTGRTLFSLVGNWFGWSVFAVAIFGLGRGWWLRRQQRATSKPTAGETEQSQTPQASGKKSKKKKKQKKSKR